jgi:amino acid transporter
MTAPSDAAQATGSSEEERHRLTALEGLAALSLDALSSVAYGPQAIMIVLATAGLVALHSYTLPVTLAIVVLLTVLVISYRQVIEAFPTGGGAYAVAKAHLGVKPSLIAAASLVVDYILNAAVGVSAGVEALTSAFPALYPDRVWLCLGVLAAITAANLWGVAESARLFIVPTLLFIAGIFAVVFGGLIRSHPLPFPQGTVTPVATVGILLLLRAFASGCSALTGVEAIANAVPEFRKPRYRRAQHTEMGLGIILGLMLIGIAVVLEKFHVKPSGTTTALAQITEGALGHNFVFYAIQLITTILLALAANTSFGGLPVLASLLATDNFLPHLFFLRAQRQVHRYGVVVLAVFAAALLVASSGDTQALVPLFAIGVFVGFTLSQAGMVRHWRQQESPGWRMRAVINGIGALFTLAALAIELISKFTEGAWLVVIVVPALVAMFWRIHTVYGRIGRALQIGQTPEPPARRTSLVVVPVAGMSRLVREGISAALSLGDEVVAVTVCFDDAEDHAADTKLREQWDQWHPDVPLLTLRSKGRSLGQPLVKYLRELEQTTSKDQLVVLIPEVEATRPWMRILHNQRGFVIEQAIQHGTANVVICRLRYRLSAVGYEPSESGSEPKSG